MLKYIKASVDIMASVMLTSSWLELAEMSLCSLCGYINTHTFVEISKPRDQVPLLCVLRAQGPDPSELKTSILDVCIHIATELCKINGMPTNFNQECV
jgi:hypothetical protein